MPIFADVTRIEQIIENLVLNAAKFTPAGGQIIVGVQPDGDYAVLRVADNGNGINPDVLPRIFQLFEQGDQPPARSNGGLGIGLAMLWTVRRAKDGKSETGRTSAREALQESGYDALAAAHSRGLARLSQDIADAIRMLDRPAP